MRMEHVEIVVNMTLAVLNVLILMKIIMKSSLVSNAKQMMIIPIFY